MLEAATRAAGVLARSLVGVAFSAAGTVLGAVLGLTSGFIKEDGLLQGALVGALTGALVSWNLADSLLRIWTCGGGSMDARIKRTRLVLRSLEAGRLLGGSSVFPTLREAMHSQMDALLPGYARARGDLFEPSSGAARRAFVGSLPAITLTKETLDAGPHTTCPICLHEFQAGESARRLPACRHLFHLACIDRWLQWKPQCPMCRHDVC